ncbi:MAG: SusD/RagB family nutrient-binding outer membrane lipoprotein [Flavobacteriales bacterium]|nr:MAG: SusD/RagB family nutrient-binding outer membrane lipoprotein [Flavobacteriales bacterium]
MKHIKIICVITLLFLATGCKKMLDINTDPASPQTTRPEFYLSSIIAKMGEASSLDNANVHFKLTQNMGSQQTNAVFERHGWTSGDSDGGVLWRHVYVDAGLNLEDMIKGAKSLGNNTLAGVGMAIKAWGFQHLTDQHGPIILDQAFEDRLYFNYQDQPAAYIKVREWCQEALVLLNTPDEADFSTALSRADYIFGQGGFGNVTTYRQKWRKFVYAILATQYNHLINKPDFATKYADSVVKYVDLSFGSTTLNASEDATIGYDGTLPANSNPNSLSNGLFGAITSGLYTNNRIGQPIVNYLTGGVRGTPTVNPTSSIDPRLTRMINPMVTPTVPATNGVYRGVIATRGDAATTKTIPAILGSVAPTFPGKYIYSNIGGGRYPLFTYAQLQFMKAEALFIKGDKAGAWSAYDRGIRGHMDFVNTYGRNGSTVAPAISGTEIATYLASSEVAPNGATLTIADIMGQKYIAQWGWAGYEQFADMRKYHWDPLVFRQWKPLETSEAFRTVNSVPSYVYRIRPRFNSEYVWNVAELSVWGANKPEYVYQETWFSLPTN